MIIKLMHNTEPEGYFISVGPRETLKTKWVGSWSSEEMGNYIGSWWFPYGEEGSEKGVRVLSIIERGEHIVIGEGVTAYLLNDEGKTIDKV